MEKIIFDKDNTLTYNRRTSFIDPKVANAFSNAVTIFGKPNVIVLSEMTPQRYIEEMVDWPQIL